MLEATAAIVRRAPGEAIVIVNDRADVALAANASGVHVGQDDLAAADVRRVVGATAIVGLSTHTAAQMRDAVGQAISYVATGPVFGTGSKETGYDALGLSRVRDAAASASAAGLPLAAIGGITLERAPAVIAAGASTVAVIADMFVGNDPSARVRAYLDRLEPCDRQGIIPPQVPEGH